MQKNEVCKTEESQGRLSKKMISNWVGNQGQVEKGSAERSAQLIKILNTRGKELDNESQGQSRYASNPY